MRSHLLVALPAMLLAPRFAAAQQPGLPDLDVRTFELRHLDPTNASKLVEAYLVSPNGGVFMTQTPSMRAITVREAPRALARIDSVLRALDRPPATVRLRFQLIAAQDERARDPRIASLDSTLRDLFRFEGYRLLAQTVVVVGQWNGFSQTFAAEGERMLLTGMINSITADADSGRVGLDVTLARPRGVFSTTEQRAELREEVLSTGLSIPIGQTVVLGSGVSGQSIAALILVVTPELQDTQPR